MQLTFKYSHISTMLQCYLKTSCLLLLTALVDIPSWHTFANASHCSHKRLF